MQETAGFVFAMMERLRSLDDDEYLQFLIAFHAAPTIRGIKPANLVCPCGAGREYRDAWLGCRGEIEKILHISLTHLRLRNDRLMIFAYRPSLLTRFLINREAAALLTELGYDPEPVSVEQRIAELRKRCQGETFPHEIGLFLGYPPLDVRAFMENRSARPNTTGCWKAYGNAERAERFLTVAVVCKPRRRN